MKRAIGVLALCLLVPPSNLPRQAAQPQRSIQIIKPVKSDKEEMGLHGPVETIREEWCVLSDKPDKSGKYREDKHNYVCTTTFDISGKRILYDPPPRYCATSWIMEQSRKHHRKYDGNGNVVEDIVTDLQGKLIHKTVQAFDSRGNCTEYAFYNADGTLDQKWLTKYDEQNNEIERVLYNLGGVYRYTEKRAYNDKGLVVELTHDTTDPSRNSKTITNYEYDSYGNWIKSIDSKLVVENGRSYFKPDRVDYRIITYHSDSEPVRDKRTKLKERRAFASQQ